MICQSKKYSFVLKGLFIYHMISFGPSLVIKNNVFGNNPNFDRMILELNYPSYYAHTLQDLRVLED